MLKVIERHSSLRDNLRFPENRMLELAFTETRGPRVEDLGLDSDFLDFFSLSCLAVFVEMVIDEKRWKA